MIPSQDKFIISKIHLLSISRLILLQVKINNHSWLKKQNKSYCSFDSFFFLNLKGNRFVVKIINFSESYCCATPSDSMRCIQDLFEKKNNTEMIHEQCEKIDNTQYI